WDLSISPKPTHRRDTIDFFGNHVVFLNFDTPHSKIKIDTRARGAIAGRSRPLPGMDPPWERVRETAFASADVSPASPVHAIFA
ncbi:transglutaminase N-terminal domain-containing protein, partial [Acinetobacter baumannii]